MNRGYIVCNLSSINVIVFFYFVTKEALELFDFLILRKKEKS